MTEWGDFEWEEDDDTPSDPPAVEVDITDPRIVAELFAPDGSVLLTLLDRPAVPFGYQPPRRP
jgi:hypothetical protein